MAIFFRAKFPESKVYEYTNDAALIQYVKVENHKRIVIPNSVSKELSLTLSENNVVQILIGSNNDLSNIVDIIIDPLEKVNLKYFYGINYLLPALAHGKYGEDIAKYLQISLKSLKIMTMQSKVQERLTQIASVIYRLKWDSKFFGSNIAFLSSLCLTKNIEKYVQGFTKSEDLDLIQFQCNCHDLLSVQIAEENKYSFVDIRLTMERPINETFIIQEDKKEIDFRKATKSDIEILVDYAKGIYHSSRYYYDKNFDTKKVDGFYSGWIKKSVLGEFDDFCYAIYENNSPIGFCSIKYNQNNSASIGLLGISPKHSNLGLGRYMLNKVIEALYADGITYIDVVTQGRNYSAQRLYQRCGFLTRTSELWYHKWLGKIS